jgi:hypothetical protein
LSWSVLVSAGRLKKQLIVASQNGLGGLSSPLIDASVLAKRRKRMEQLTDFLAATLEACVDRGMQLPFVVCAVARNYSVLAMRVNGAGTDGEVLAEHFENDAFELPINIMVVSQNNEAVRLTIEQEGGGKIRTTFH